MPKTNSRKKKSPKRVLPLPDLEQAKTAVLNSLRSASVSGRTTTQSASSSHGTAPSRLGHVSIQATERYLGCKQKLRVAVNDTLGIEPEPAA